MADATQIDEAVLAVLRTDAALLTLCPDGVYWDVARAGARFFVIVTQFDQADVTGQNDQDLYERTIYLVKAVLNEASTTRSGDAAARIHTLLHRAPLNLSAAGYTWMATRRIGRVHYTEPDPVDQAARWQHHGGQYEVTASPN